MYDFDRIIDRKGTNAIKLEACPKNMIPLWVADMDFSVAPEIQQAMKDCIDHFYQLQMIIKII